MAGPEWSLRPPIKYDRFSSEAADALPEGEWGWESGTTASLAVPVTTAASLSVSSDEDGPDKADQKEEASFEVMWDAAVAATAAAAAAAVASEAPAKVDEVAEAEDEEDEETEEEGSA